MLNEMMRHWRYFIPKLAIYGIWVGGLFGALTYPILGVFIGAPWGFVASLLLGSLMGIAVPIYNRYFAPDDSQDYQTQLTFGAGMLTILVMAIPLLFIYALPAGMVAAYLAHQYAEDPTVIDEKRKHSIDLYQKEDGVFTMAVRHLMSNVHYVVALGVIVALFAYGVISFVDPFTTFDWILTVIIGVSGVIYGYLVAAVIAMTDALFIMMANRLFFDVDTPKSHYKPRIIASVAVLTLFLSMIVTAGIGAPFAAIAGAFGAAKYADWYYETSAEEKAKRSADNLREDEVTEDELLIEHDVEHEEFSHPM